MEDDPHRSVKRLTDPRALRALAHPIRISLVSLLRREGPLTATQAAELLGESSASCSFHLRQLAKYGLVEEAGGGRGREKPWRATTMFTGWPDVADTPELAAATGLLTQVIAERYFDAMMRWLDARADEPQQWQEAAHFGDTFLYATPDEMVELARAEQKLLEPFLDRQAQPELRPPESRLITYLHLAFPGDLTGTPAKRGTDTERGTGTGRGTDTDRGTGTGRGTDTDRGADTSRGTDTDPGTGTGRGGDIERGTGTGRGSSSGRSASTQRNPATGSGPGAGRDD
jgi:DNA-binding transcriptional ArsR family regulator